SLDWVKKLHGSANGLSFLICENLDNWPLDAHDRCLHFPFGRARDEIACRCTIVARVEALPAIQQGGTLGLVRQSRNSLPTFSRAWRAAKGKAGIKKYRMAECVISRLCRLHGDR